MSEDNPEANQKQVTRRDFLKLSALGLGTLALKPNEFSNTTSDKEPTNIPEPEDLLCVKLVDREHPLEQSFIKEEIEPELKPLSQFSPEGFLRRADVTGKVRIHSLVVQPLEDLLIASSIAGVDIKVRSGYRSWEEQELIHKREGEDNKTSMLPGTSQHHTGLALDFTTLSIGNVAKEGAGFEKTREYEWLVKNAWEYGFVISYDRGHDGITNESWHWIYVGKNVAEYFQALRKNGWESEVFDLQKAYLEKRTSHPIRPERPVGGGGKYKLE